MGFKTSILLQYNDHILFPSPRQYPCQRDLAHRGVFQLLGPPPLCEETRKRDRRDKCFFTAWGVEPSWAVLLAALSVADIQI